MISEVFFSVNVEVDNLMSMETPNGNTIYYDFFGTNTLVQKEIYALMSGFPSRSQ